MARASPENSLRRSEGKLTVRNQASTARFSTIVQLKTPSTRSYENIFLYILNWSVLYYRENFKNDRLLLTTCLNIAKYQ